ncbi:MAG: alpha/beta hydrolase [Arenicellales bacterium]
MTDVDWADRSFAETAGASTAYTVSGAGPALVMIHGVGLNASVWEPQIRAFESRYQAIAYDTLGHGASAPPRPAATLKDYLEQLLGLLDALEIDRAVLMGHSMGSLIAARFAIDHADRVEALVAANPVYRRPPAQLASSRARIRALEARGSGAALPETLARWFGDPVDSDSPAVRQVETWIRQADPVGYARAYRVFSEADPWLDGRLQGLSAPALFVTGELDPNSSPAMARTMAAETPLGCAVILEGQRHMMSYVSPALFNPVVSRFLDQAAAPPGRTACRGGA